MEPNEQRLRRCALEYRHLARICERSAETFDGITGSMHTIIYAGNIDPYFRIAKQRWHDRANEMRARAAFLHRKADAIDHHVPPAALIDPDPHPRLRSGANRDVLLLRHPSDANAPVWPPRPGGVQ